MAAQACSRAMGEEHCVLHPEEKLLFECKDCNEELTCIECVGTIHHGHAMVRIKQTVGEKVTKIEEFIKRTEESTLPKVVKEIKLTIGTLKENKEKCQHEIKEVKEHEKRLKELVEHHSSTNISKLELLLKQTTDLLNKHKGYLERLQQETENDIKNCKQTVKSGTEVLQHDTETQVVKRKTDVKISKIPSVTSPLFNPCKDPSSLIAEAFGDVRADPVENFGDTIAAQVSSEDKFLDQPKTLYESSTPYLVATNSIYCTPNNHTWVLDENGTFHCYDHTGKEIQTLTPDVRLYRICTHPTTAEMFGTYRIDTNKSIRRVNSETGTTSVMFHIHNVPVTIGCTNNNHIVVCMNNNTIKMFSFEGRVLHTYRYKGEYVLPISVCPFTNNIALPHGNEGSVTVLDHTLQKMYQYTGQGGSCNFWTAAFTNKYLLVGDFNNRYILVLDKGTLVHTLHTKEMTEVNALSVQQDGVLYVGCKKTDKILKIKYTE